MKIANNIPFCIFFRAYNNLYGVKEYEMQYLTEGKMKLAD